MYIIWVYKVHGKQVCLMGWPLVKCSPPIKFDLFARSRVMRDNYSTLFMANLFSNSLINIHSRIVDMNMLSSHATVWILLLYSCDLSFFFHCIRSMVFGLQRRTRSVSLYNCML